TIPLECDVYSSGEYPSSSPVFLYFHSGGLVSGSRECVPPWLVQICFKNQWVFVSASYRKLPQAEASGLLQDATDAYCFARCWGVIDEFASKRNVIVGGSSSGFFMASLTAHHLEPSPVALLSITGITTFRHPFFSSSVLLPPEPIHEAQMSHHLSTPVSIGTTSANNPRVFHVDKILQDGTKNTEFALPPLPISDDGNCDEFPRGCLYDYYLYRNEFLNLVGEVDPGYEWAKAEGASVDLQRGHTRPLYRVTLMKMLASV
ncbi:hypothetical protein BDP55DRAFT_757056, partial [Colletotrichum godetiae]